MSTKRTIDMRDMGPRITGICTWCKGPVKKPKRYWCSDECVHEYKIRSDSAYARVHVLERDQGVCRGCGIDTVAIYEAFENARKTAVADINARFEALGFSLDLQSYERFVQPRHMWEMDHITAVVEGGGSCGLDGLQTLCQRCHKAKTKEMATRRARERKR